MTFEDYLRGLARPPAAGSLPVSVLVSGRGVTLTVESGRPGQPPARVTGSGDTVTALVSPAVRTPEGQ